MNTESKTFRGPCFNLACSSQTSKNLGPEWKILGRTWWQTLQASYFSAIWARYFYLVKDTSTYLRIIKQTSSDSFNLFFFKDTSGPMDPRKWRHHLHVLMYHLRVKLPSTVCVRLNQCEHDGSYSYLLCNPTQKWWTGYVSMPVRESFARGVLPYLIMRSWNWIIHNLSNG